MEKKKWYLVVVFIGLLLIIIEAFHLAASFSKEKPANIWVQLFMIALYIALTASNFIAYKKEIRKERNKKL